MTHEIRIAAVNEKPLLHSLLQAYLGELSQFEEIRRNKSGEYEYRYLRFYWTENTRWPYLFYADGYLVGFALVWQHEDTFIMAEFTVLPEFRKQGLGKTFASDVIKKHPGKWNIEYDTPNEAGSRFWNKLVTTLPVNALKKQTAGHNRESLDFIYITK
jgi:predicted acetyltransferase